MKLIDLITKDCATLEAILKEQGYFLNQILETYQKPIQTALTTKDYLRILPYSDGVWGASCHGVVPRDLVKFVPQNIRQTKDKITYVPQNYIRHLNSIYDETPIIISENEEGFYLHDLMSKVEQFADSNIHTYLSERYGSVFYEKKVPWTWYELGKNVSKRLKQLPTDKNNLSNTLLYFKTLEYKDLEVDEEIGYPGLVLELPKHLAISIINIPCIKSTFKLFSHFQVETQR